MLAELTSERSVADRCAILSDSPDRTLVDESSTNFCLTPLCVKTAFSACRNLGFAPDLGKVCKKVHCVKNAGKMRCVRAQTLTYIKKTAFFRKKSGK